MYTISFQTFFVSAFKIVVDSWKFSMLLLYILWDDWLIFMISASNEQLQQQLEYTLLDYHSWYYLPNPSARAGHDTRSIFKRSLTGFEFRVFLLLD